MKKVLVFISIMLTASLLSAQTSRYHFNLQQGISFRRDSVLKMQLLQQLSDFMIQAESGDRSSQEPYTNLLLDEWKGLDKVLCGKDTLVARPTLTGLVRLQDSVYRMNIIYWATYEQQPLLRAELSLIGRITAGGIFMESPARRQLEDWNKWSTGNFTFYYRKAINKPKAKQLAAMSATCDGYLNTRAIQTKQVCARDLQEAMQLLGVAYKYEFANYNGLSFSRRVNAEEWVVDGVLTPQFTGYDAHDLWHNRLHRHAGLDSVNKWMDEAYAYLLGGSWGLSWQEIRNQFYTRRLNGKPDADWLQLSDTYDNFADSNAYPLYTNYVLCALILQDVLKTQGKEAALQLLYCGRMKGKNENFFKRLYELTGINRENFNTRIRSLILRYREA